MSISSTLKAALLADATIAGIVSTRVFTASDVGREGLQLSDMKSGSSPIVQPTIYINMVDASREALDAMKAEKVECNIYFYQHSAYNHCQALRVATRNLLHSQYLTEGSQTYWFVRDRDFWERKDQRFSPAPSMEMTRYFVKYLEI